MIVVLIGHDSTYQLYNIIEQYRAIIKTHQLVSPTHTHTLENILNKQTIWNHNDWTLPTAILYTREGNPFLRGQLVAHIWLDFFGVANDGCN